MNSLIKDTLDRMVNDIMNGTPPWRKSWKMDMPHNAVTNKMYRGSNVMLLWFNGYESFQWAGYSQWKSIGAQVRKGEKATKIINMGIVGEGDERRPMFRATNVWNADQVEGYEPPDVSRGTHTPNEQVEAMLKAHAVDLRRGSPAYSPSGDWIRMPEPETFDSSDLYYHTLLHEVTHYTGHSTRCDRNFSRNEKKGTTDDACAYAKEELVAEIGASSLYAHYGFETPTTDLGDASYLAGWMSRIPADERSNALLTSASLASEAFCYLTETTQEKVNGSQTQQAA